MRRIATILAGVLAFGFLAAAPTLASPAPARLSCTSAGAVTTGGAIGPPGNAYAFWTALPKPEPQCEEQLRVEAYDNAGEMNASGWLRSTSANLGRATVANVPGGGILIKAREESQFNNDPGSRLCRTFYPTSGSWHSCTNAK